LNNNTVNINNKTIEQGISTKVIIDNYNLDVTSEILKLNLNFSIVGMSSGSIILNDINSNIFNSIPLVGGEFVTVIFHSIYSSKPILIKIFNISKIEIIDKNLKIGNSKSKFRIYLTSTAILSNNMTKMSKGYSTPRKSSDIVQDICKNNLNIDESISLILKSNTILENFIIPWMYPLDAIQYLKMISSNEKEKDFYLFYEGLYNYNFVPLSELVKQTPKIRLDRQISNDITKGISILRINDDRFVSGIDLLSSLKMQGLGGTYVYFDSKAKKAVEVEYTINKSFLDDIDTLGSFSRYNEIIANNTSKSNYNISTSDSEYHDKFAYYNIRKESFNKYNLKVKIAGTLDINVGQTIYVEHNQNGSEVNTWFTGTWIVSGVSLIFSFKDDDSDKLGRPTFKTELILTKDTYGSMKRDTATMSNLIKTTTNINNDIVNKRGE